MRFLAILHARTPLEIHLGPIHPNTMTASLAFTNSVSSDGYWSGIALTPGDWLRNWSQINDIRERPHWEVTAEALKDYRVEDQLVPFNWDYALKYKNAAHDAANNTDCYWRGVYFLTDTNFTSALTRKGSLYPSKEDYTSGVLLCPKIRLMKTRRVTRRPRKLLLLIIAAFSMFVMGCEKIYHPTLQPISTKPINSTESIAITPEASSSTRCIDLKTKLGLPVSGSLMKTHILYLSSPVLSTKEQVWVLSVADGSENLLLDDVPSPFLAMGFLPDGYHFLLAGQITMESNLNGDPLIKVDDPSIFAENFPRYSAVWDLISTDSEAGLNRYSQMGSFSLYSPDKIHVATWGNKSEQGATNNRYSLSIGNKNTGIIKVLIQTKLPDTIEGADWSPDGNFLAFTLYKNVTPYSTQVYIVNADGTELHPLSRSFEFELLSRPRWSHDGQKIAIPYRGDDGWYHMAIITRFTGEIKNFTTSPIVKMNSREDKGEMTWSPDDQWISYISQAADHYGIEILNVENGQIYCGNNNANLGIEMMDWR